MLAAFEVCGEFLCHIGALEGANAIAEILHKTGVELSDTSPFRWRALLAAIRHELDAKPMDVVFLLERLLQLGVTMPSGLSYALFGSPLFLHLLAERFAVAFEGLDAEVFKLESDEMCHAEGIYETCILLRDKIEENENSSGLTTFLEAFKKIFEQDEPKDCWDAFYERYHLNGTAFRRDMKRALYMIESTTLGPTKLELAFPTQSTDGPKKVVPRALLEKRFGGTRRDWRDLSQIVTIAEGGADRIADDEQAQEQEQEIHTLTSTAVEGPRFSAESPEVQNWVSLTRVPISLNGETTESVHSDISKEAPTPERSVSSRPPRTTEVARVTRQEGRRAAPRTRASSEDDGAIERRSTGRLSSRRKRVRWSAEEEAALIEGYRLYESYSNVWMLIKMKFPVVLQNRSNVDLKDKYRNLMKYGQIQRSTSDSNDNAGVTDNDTTDDNAGAGDENDTTDA